VDDPSPPDERPASASSPHPPPVERAHGEPPPVDGPRRGRRVLGVALAVLVAAAGVGIGFQQRQVAASWQQRAQETATVRDDALGRVDALQRQLDEVADALAVSESDVVELEDRVRELADEKAQAEDVATTTGVERDTLVELSSAIAGSIGALDGCVDELFDLLNDAIDAFNRQGEGADVDVGPLNAARTTTTAGCNAAKQDAADASLEAQQLLR
jgi:cell division protein FtsB